MTQPNRHDKRREDQLIQRVDVIAVYVSPEHTAEHYLRTNGRLAELKGNLETRTQGDKR